MSDKIKDGGPAFPFRATPSSTYTLADSSGMSLRDWFAGQALPAKIADAEQFNERCVRSSSGSRLTKSDVAAACYKYADAMLDAREK